MEKREFRVFIEPPAEAHGSQLYDGPLFGEGAEGFGDVGAEELEHYRTQGFLQVKQAFPPEIVQGARRALHELGLSDRPACDAVYFEGSIQDILPKMTVPRAGGANPGVEDLALGATLSQLPDVERELRATYVRKFMGFTREQNPALQSVAEHPPLLECVARLLQAKPLLYQDMAMIKPPDGREKPWHQDRAFFNLSSDTGIVGVWIALDPATPENGCMRVQPGGHRVGPLTHEMQRDWQISDSQAQAFPRLVIPMQPGDCLLFDALLPHGTPHNGTNQKRWALQYHFVSERARSITDEMRLAAFGPKAKS